VGGYGRLTWPDGHSYQGTFRRGETQGLGRRVWTTGHWFVGEEAVGLKEGVGADARDGLGLMRFPGGKWYLGGWKGGARDGEAVEGDGGRCRLVWNAGGEEVEASEVPIAACPRHWFSHEGGVSLVEVIFPLPSALRHFPPV
ncbi:hypothetical protein T484DRAFT_1810536, partial [Baffinella frigidus]